MRNFSERKMEVITSSSRSQRRSPNPMRVIRHCRVNSSRLHDEFPSSRDKLKQIIANAQTSNLHMLRAFGSFRRFKEPTAEQVATNYGIVLRALNDGLLRAVEKKQIENVNVLIEIKANPETTDDAGYSALMWATHVESAECVESLLKHKANVNAITIWGWTALMDAAQLGNEEILSNLISAKAHVNQRVVDLGRCALHEAAIVDCPANVRRLIDAGAVHYIDYQGDSALILAASSGLLENVKVLAEHLGSSVLNHRRIVFGILVYTHCRLPGCIADLICQMAIPPCELGRYNINGMSALNLAHTNLHHEVVSYLQLLMGR